MQIFQSNVFFFAYFFPFVSAFTLIEARDFSSVYGLISVAIISFFKRKFWLFGVIIEINEYFW